MNKTIIKRIIFLLLIMLITFGSLSLYLNNKNNTKSKITTTDENKIIQFKDENLKQKIKDSSGITTQDITTEQASKITKLDLSNSTITSLKGLEHFNNLKELNISSNLITNIKRVKKLTKLTTID